MPTIRTTTVIAGCASFALALACAPALQAQEPGAAKAQPPAAVPSPAEVAGSPDWPCVQRKVDEISPAQVWDGPSIDGLKDWEKDDKIQELIPILESRRISLEDAEKAIKEYAAAQPEGERDKKLTLLFAGVFDKFNSDRKFVIGRVEEFQKRQKGRAAELEREGKTLGEKNQPIPSPDSPAAGEVGYKLTPEQETYNWNARIFQDRQQNLSLACEIPGLIEARAFDIAKLIRAQMKG
jgi:hypothetical protein